VKSSRARRVLLWFVQLVVLMLIAGPAAAAGRIEWKEKTLKERDGTSWRVELAIYLPKAPDVAHVPMKFEFQPTVYYERSIVDGDKELERKVPLENRQALIESVDVGFLDSSTGNIEKRTKFSFKVTRAHGYEAGEYKVTVKDTRNGQTVGTPITLIFDGKNELIDRRAMVFTGKKKEKKDDGGAAKEGEEKKDDGAADEAEKSGDEAAPAESSDTPAPGAEDDSGDEPEPAGEIKEKPGGCGCRLEDTRSSGSSALVLGALLGLALLRRRRAA
jgi:MYXO-CTERM domain-containing protein